MASALAALANATVTFEVPGTGTTVEVDTGNVVPVKETLTVSCYLKQGSVGQEEMPGIFISQTFYEGYTVEPAVLDARVRAGTKGTIAFSGGASCYCVVLQTSPLGTQGLLGSILSATMGTALRLVERREY